MFTSPLAAILAAVILAGLGATAGWQVRASSEYARGMTAGAQQCQAAISEETLLAYRTESARLAANLDTYQKRQAAADQELVMLRDELDARGDALLTATDAAKCLIKDSVVDLMNKPVRARK